MAAARAAKATDPATEPATDPATDPATVPATDPATVPATVPATETEQAPVVPAGVASPADEATTPASPVEPPAEVDVPFVEEVGTFVVHLSIGGTRDGVAWPEPGETIVLPLAEAADYLRFGYITEPE